MFTGFLLTNKQIILWFSKLICFEMICYSNFLARIEVESLLQDCCIFSWRKKATKGSSFFALEKNNKTKKLGTDSRNSF
jgi:hypothetical protein